MANIRNGNTFYIDTQYSAASDELASKGIKVIGIFVTSTAAGGRVVLADSSIATKLDLRVTADEDTVYFDLSNNPIIFSTSLRPTTLSGALVTCVLSVSTY